MDLKNSIINSKTPIQKFYSEKSILITGSTGFLGQVLVEKILRTFPDVEKLILILRDKKGKSGYERIEEYFNNALFSKIHTKDINYKSKIHAVIGDIAAENLGLNQEDIEMIINSVSIVFHVAATVNFKVPLKKAVAVNVQGSSEVIKLSKKVKDLKCLIYVSTAFNHFEKTREEKIYPHPIAPKSLIQIVEGLDDSILSQVEPFLLGKWLNVYTYTKNAGENLFIDTTVPTGIFRPSIVSSTISEPLPSWTDSMNGVTGMTASMGLGLKRVIKGDPRAKAPIVPVDMVVNALIAIAWDVAGKRNDDTNVYNYTPEENAVNWKDYIRLAMKDVDDVPFNKAIWYKSTVLTNSIWMYYLIYFTRELLPAAIFDFFTWIVGQKPWLINTYRNIHHNFMLCSNFGSRVWKFEANNVNKLWDCLCEEDKTLLNFNIRSINWEKYLADATIGIKKFYFKEDMSPKGVSKAKNRYRILYWLHQVVKFGLYSLSLAVLVKLFY